MTPPMHLRRVLAFSQSSFASLEEINLVTFLIDGMEDAWSIRLLAQRHCIPYNIAQRHLTNLIRANLIRFAFSDGIASVRDEPATDQLNLMGRTVSAAFKAHRLVIITRISARKASAQS